MRVLRKKDKILSRLLTRVARAKGKLRRSDRGSLNLILRSNFVKREEGFLRSFQFYFNFISFVFRPLGVLRKVNETCILILLFAFILRISYFFFFSLLSTCIDAMVTRKNNLDLFLIGSC